MSASYYVIACVALLLATIFFFVKAFKKQKQKKLNFESYIQQLCKQYGLSLDKREHHQHFFLGLDTVNKKLLYVKDLQTTPIATFISLQVVKECKEFQEIKTVYMDRDQRQSETVVTEFGLELISKEQSHRVIIYDYISNNLNQLSDLRSISQQWAKTLKEVHNERQSVQLTPK